MGSAASVWAALAEEEEAAAAAAVVVEVFEQVVEVVSRC